jgi:hypothetical protein
MNLDLAYFLVFELKGSTFSHIEVPFLTGARGDDAHSEI